MCLLAWSNLLVGNNDVHAIVSEKDYERVSKHNWIVGLQEGTFACLINIEFEICQKFYRLLLVRNQTNINTSAELKGKYSQRLHAWWN